MEPIKQPAHTKSKIIKCNVCGTHVLDVFFDWHMERLHPNQLATQL